MNVFIPGIGENESIYFNPQIYKSNDGPDELIITGQIESEIEQSVYISLTLIRKQGIKIPTYLHIHFPHYEYDKTGISASLGIFFQLFTSITNKRLKKKYIMTGEIDIEGNIYGIGQIKEKIDVFKQNDFDYMIIPYENKNFAEKNIIAVQNIYELNEIIKLLEDKNEV